MRLRAHSFLTVILFVLFRTVAAAQTPGPPTGLNVTPHDDRTVTLQWTGPSTGGTPTGYQVEVGTSSGATDAFQQTVGLVTTYRPPGMFTVGTTYFFRVRALNGSGVSSASNEVVLTIPCPPPVMPQHLSWRPFGPNGVQVVWVGGSGATVQFGSNPGLSDVLIASPTPGHNENAVTVTLPPGVSFARVVSRSPCSPATAVSPDLRVTAGEAYGSPPVLINEIGGFIEHSLNFVELKNVGSDPVNLGNWKLLSGLFNVFFVATIPAGTTLAPGCTYLVGRTAVGFPTPDLSLSLIESHSAGLVDPTGRIRDSVAADEDNDNGIPYVFAEGERERDVYIPASIARMADVDTNDNLADFVYLGTGTPQNSSACNAGGLPPPSPLRATVTAGTVTLDWMSVPTNPPVLQYALEVGLTPGATHFGPFAFGPNQTTITFQGVPDGTYYARVRATNANGTSAPTNEVALVVCWQNCTLPPGAVSQLIFQVSGSNVLLAWTAPTTGGAVTGYVIEGGTASGLSDLGRFPTGSMVAFVVVSGVPPGTYFVRVRATNGSALGPPSNEVVIVVQ